MQNSSKVPEFHKQVTMGGQVVKRLRSLFPNQMILAFKIKGDYYVVKPIFDENNSPTFKIAMGHVYKYYCVELDFWNEMLLHIHNGFIFPGDDLFSCTDCGCPHLYKESDYGSEQRCKACDKKFHWNLVEDVRC